MSRICEIADGSELARFLELAADRPVWLFKHSRTCGVSSQAQDRFRRFVDGRPEDDGNRFARITVQSARDASQALVAMTGVRHESPQVLLLQDGRVVWHASHWRIDEESLAEAAAGLAAPAEGAARLEE